MTQSISYNFGEVIPLHPTHPNGSGEKNLRDQFLKIHEVLDEAIKVIRSNAPHSRDYLQGFVPTAGKDVYNVAYEATCERLRALEDIQRFYVQDYLTAFVGEV